MRCYLDPLHLYHKYYHTHSLREIRGLLIYILCLCWLHVLRWKYWPSPCCAHTALEHNLLFIFTLSDLLCINIESLVWTGNENSDHSSLRPWRRHRPLALASRYSRSSGRSRSAVDLNWVTSAYCWWPLRPGTVGIKCTLPSLTHNHFLCCSITLWFCLTT